jgi:serine/threonine protein kinase
MVCALHDHREGPLQMSFTPRPTHRAQDELGDATDMVTCAPTDKQLTEMGGLTPTDPLDESTALMMAADVASVMHRSMPTPRGPAPLPISPRSARLARGSSSELGEKTPPIRRATTQNTVSRAMLEDDTAPNPIVVEETRPMPVPTAAKRMLGGYKITGTLASGQMGVVYRGEHPTARRPPVAIKAVHNQLQTYPAIAARFFAESIVLARVVHPNVVRFHDFGYDAAGSAYLVMELLEGETLSSRLARERRLDISVAIDIAMQLTQGIAAAHEQGIVHRDIKPDNVFVCSDGRVKLLDFGVAKIEGQGPTQTLQGDLLGTAAYMAPEQGRSASESDARSDLYSFGCILFEMVCGVVPFPGSLVETLVAHQTAQRPPARALNAEVSDELDAIIDRLLARDPAERPRTAVDVIRALGALESTTQRPLRRIPRSGTFIDMRRRARTSPLVRLARAPVTLGVLATILGLVISMLVLR